MKLFYSANSPYARKARIIIRELDMMARVEEIAVTLPADAALRAVNPLGKIPALVLDDGSCIYDSRVICEYLDEYGDGHFFPRRKLLREGQGRWRALTLQSLGDGLADAVIRRQQELRLPDDKRSAGMIEHQSKAIDAAFAVIERACAKFAAHPTIGELAVVCAIGYLDLRAPEDGWRGRFPNTARWLETFSRFPSVAATKPS